MVACPWMNSQAPWSQALDHWNVGASYQACQELHALAVKCVLLLRGSVIHEWHRPIVLPCDFAVNEKNKAHIALLLPASMYVLRNGNVVC